MKQIYDFEKYAPPALSEKTLRQEFERRKLRRQMFLLALAAVLSQIAVFLMGLLAWESRQDFAVCCFVYAAVSIVGSVVIAIVYSYRGKAGDEICQELL